MVFRSYYIHFVRQFFSESNILRLSGFTPFQVKTEQELFDAISNAKYSFPDPEWTEVSDEGKGFVSRLLVVDPSLRMTAAQALKDDWMAKFLQDDARQMYVRSQSSFNPARFKEYMANRKINK